MGSQRSPFYHPIVCVFAKGKFLLISLSAEEPLEDLDFDRTENSIRLLLGIKRK